MTAPWESGLAERQATRELALDEQQLVQSGLRGEPEPNASPVASRSATS